MTRRGVIELVTLLTDVDDMILHPEILDNEIENNNNNTKKVFRGKSIICGDNFFFDYEA